MEKKTYQPPSSVDFDEYIREERDAFVLAINEAPWNTKQRTQAENLLIAYDQMRDKLQAASGSDAVEFAEFIGREGLKLYSEGWCQPGGSNGMHLSTYQLYQLFKSKQPTP